MRLEMRPWTWMYIAAGVSVLACVGVIYVVTTTGDVSVEWVSWVFFGLAVSLVAGGYYLERDHRKKHGDPRLSEFEDVMKGDG